MEFSIFYLKVVSLLTQAESQPAEVRRSLAGGPVDGEHDRLEASPFCFRGLRFAQWREESRDLVGQLLCRDDHAARRARLLSHRPHRRLVVFMSDERELGR